MKSRVLGPGCGRVACSSVGWVLVAGTSEQKPSASFVATLGSSVPRQADTRAQMTLPTSGFTFTAVGADVGNGLGTDVGTGLGRAVGKELGRGVGKGLGRVELGSGVGSVVGSGLGAGIGTEVGA